MRDLTLVFDLDGTLVDTAPDLVHATNHVLAGLGFAPVAAENLRPWISYGARRMIVEGLGMSGQRASEATLDRLLDTFLEHYAINIAYESRPFPGAVAALDRFIEQGARLALCTNKREALTLSLLDQLDLTRRFAAIAGRDTFAVSKPHPDHLRGVVARAGGSLARAVMIGDSEVDIATAKAARVPVVAVTFGYTQIPVSRLSPNATIDRYDELEAAVRRVLDGD
jgi:phosphoglycolate phosphatase